MFIDSITTTPRTNITTTSSCSIIISKNFNHETILQSLAIKKRLKLVSPAQLLLESPNCTSYLRSCFVKLERINISPPPAKIESNLENSRFLTELSSLNSSSPSLGEVVMDSEILNPPHPHLPQSPLKLLVNGALESNNSVNGSHSATSVPNSTNLKNSSPKKTVSPKALAVKKKPLSSPISEYLLKQNKYRLPLIEPIFSSDDDSEDEEPQSHFLNSIKMTPSSERKKIKADFDMLYEVNNPQPSTSYALVEEMARIHFLSQPEIPPDSKLRRKLPVTKFTPKEKKYINKTYSKINRKSSENKQEKLFKKTILAQKRVKRPKEEEDDHKYSRGRPKKIPKRLLDF